MKARAEASARTHARILEAATERFGSTPYDEVSLSDIAEDADVTVQTVLRRFGSKEELLGAAARKGLDRVRADRSAAPVGDVRGAIRNLIEHYEAWGNRVLMLLSQEKRVEALAQVTQAGRQLHYVWVEQVFRPWLETLSGEARAKLRGKLIAATDVHVWEVLRRDLGWDVRTTEVAMREIVASLLR
jgi:AcrR family transcriptional regulator